VVWHWALETRGVSAASQCKVLSLPAELEEEGWTLSEVVVAEFSEWLSDGTKEGGVVDECTLLEVEDGGGEEEEEEDDDREVSVGVDSLELSDGVSSCRRATSGAVVGAGTAVTAWRQKRSASAKIRYR
jgi:hypothetical protein